MISSYLSFFHIFFFKPFLTAGKHPACDPSYFGRREFSFSLGNDTYCRYQSFDSVTEFENSIKKNCPFKIDIGPVYRVNV